MDWSSLHVFPDASAAPSAGGAFDIRTPPAPGAYGVVIPSGVSTEAAADIVGVRFVLDVELLSGSVGLFASKLVDTDPLGAEVVLRSPGQRVTVRVDGDRATTRLCVRSGPAGAGHVRIHSGRSFLRRRFDITACIERLLPTLLVKPGMESMIAAARALSEGRGIEVSPDEIGELGCTKVPVARDAGALWTDDHGRRAFEISSELIALLPTYDWTKMNARHGYRDREGSAGYLKQSVIRVYYLLRELERRGIRGGTVLEIGSLFGQFSLVLQRLGFKVTCVDRYRGYDGALDGYVAHLRESGVTVINADRHDEAALTAGLGTFDVVLSMAVIEHIPHTPREFLAMLGSHVAPGGLLALDTPNIARYWNRRRLNTGWTVHQGIENQFYSSVPYEGHHREFTAAELAWMLEQIGGVDVTTRMFDYNLLQFPELWSDQLHSLFTIAIDPSQADTVLVAGRIDQFRNPEP